MKKKRQWWNYRLAGKAAIVLSRWPTERAVLVVLCGHASEQSDYVVRPAVETIALESGLQDRTVRKALAALRGAVWITPLPGAVDETGRPKGGKHRSTEYVVNQAKIAKAFEAWQRSA